MDWQEWFESAWEQREERVYRELFGAATGGIYPLDHDSFEPFRKGDVDPRWLTHGVLKFPPNERRPTWLFVTSGLSNAWHDEEPNPNEWSGLGCELVLETLEDFTWALFHVRRLLAFQILLGWGRYEGREPFTIGDRIPLRNPIDGERSELTWYLVAPTSGYPSDFQLPSGRAEFLHLVGITESEAAFARDNGHEALLEKLKPEGYPVTVPGRPSAV
jgi:hypothetical protein